MMTVIKGLKFTLCLWFFLKLMSKNQTWIDSKKWWPKTSCKKTIKCKQKLNNILTTLTISAPPPCSEADGFEVKQIC